MEPKNIQDFNALVGIVFSELYEAFPKKITLYTDRLLGYNIKDTWSEDNLSSLHVVRVSDGSETTILIDELQVAFDGIQWLQENGLISFRSSSPFYHVSGATLTEKGLAVMNWVPSSVVENKSLGMQLIEAAKDGGKQAIGTLAGQALGLGAKFIAQSLPNF